MSQVAIASAVTVLPKPDYGATQGIVRRTWGITYLTRGLVVRNHNFFFDIRTASSGRRGSCPVRLAQPVLATPAA